jgi:hypothetical protein
VPDANLGKRVSLECATGVTFVDGGAELRHFRVIALLLYGFDAGAYHVLDAREVTGCDFSLRDAGDVLREVGCFEMAGHDVNQVETIAIF